MMRLRPGPAFGSSRGFTLLELLVVLVLIGFAVAVATVQVNSMWQKFKMEGTATDIRNFLQDAYNRMGTTRAPVFVQLKTDVSPKLIRICNDNACTAAANVLATYEIPEYVSLSITDIATNDSDWASTPAPASAAVRIIGCDTFGRTTNSKGDMVGVPQNLIVTHVDYVSGRLTPRTRYTITVAPLWSVRLVRELV